MKEYKKRSHTFPCAMACITMVLISACSPSPDTEIESNSSETFISKTALSDDTDFVTEKTSLTVLESTETTYYEEMLGETVPHEGPFIDNVEDVYAYAAPEVQFGLGLGNPVITENVVEKYGSLTGKDDKWLRECEKDTVLDQIDYLISTESAEDAVGYCELWKLGYDSMISDAQNGEDCAFDIELIRYIMSENGLRFWIDEIPYSLFESMFPEYIELYCEREEKIRLGEIGEADWNFEQIVCSDEVFSYFIKDLKRSFKNATESYIQETSPKDLKSIIFRQMTQYNVSRMSCIYGSKLFSCGQIEIGKTLDGKYIAVPNKEQYDKLISDIHSIPRCENMDILTVETREDLIQSGIDVEKYEKIYNKAFESRG